MSAVRQGDFDGAFETALLALEPGLDGLVLVGGWTMHVLRSHPLARRPDHPSIRTTDLDLLSDLESLRRTDPGALLLRAGLTETLEGDVVPPVTRYELRTASGPFHVEFLVQQRGAQRSRTGELRATTRSGQTGAQFLAHVGVLSASPWKMAWPVLVGTLAERSLSLRVANPVSYIVQKLLTLRSRQKPEKKAKDLLYLVDALGMFGDEMDALQSTWTTDVRSALSRPELRMVASMTAMVSTAGDAHERASAMARHLGWREVDTGADIATACRIGLSRLLDNEGPSR